MSIFKAFSSRTLLPVRVNEIAKWVKDKGFAHTIYFHPMDRDPGIVAGLVRVDKYRPPYAQDDIVTADIPFSTQIAEPHQRITGAKEVIHILEKDEYAANSYESITDLVRDMVIPTELLADMSKMSRPGLLDHGGILTALAVLFPPAARDLLINLRAKGHIGIKEIAALANLPEAYMEFLLSERWGNSLSQLCK